MLLKKILNRVKINLENFIFRWKNSGIHKTVTLKNTNKITLGKNCRIGEQSYLLCWNEYCHGKFHQKLNSSLTIGDNFNATRNLTIQCCNSITIGDNVLVASNVFIADYNHGIINPENYYINNELVVKHVSISDGVWIGQGSYILPGVNIGKYSIIGAGSVVTKDIPDYSMAVGNPAKIIKKYDLQSKKWEIFN